ncbi:MAG: hypothetical protein ABIV21_03835 [Pyrinomonadaceae bacterium]
MKLHLSRTSILIAFFTIIASVAAAFAQSDSLIVKGTFKGTLHIGKTSSYLLYVGEESGDFAAFCFTNSSKAGRKLLASCGRGVCEFKGTVDQGATCKVDAATQRVLSGSGRVLSVTSARVIAASKASAAAKPVSSVGVSGSSDAVVRSLYTAHNAKRGPFFQDTNRSLVDRYFTRGFGDLIWRDRIDSKGEAGVIDFDPLYNAQDVRIKGLKIGKPEPGEGNVDLADVPVTFTNMGKKQLILFRLLRAKDKKWYISDIFYPESEVGMPSLKDHLKKYVGK